MLADFVLSSSEPLSIPFRRKYSRGPVLFGQKRVFFCCPAYSVQKISSNNVGKGRRFLFSHSNAIKARNGGVHFSLLLLLLLIALPHPIFRTSAPRGRGEGEEKERRHVPYFLHLSYWKGLYPYTVVLLDSSFHGSSLGDTAAPLSLCCLSPPLTEPATPRVSCADAVV